MRLNDFKTHLNEFKTCLNDFKTWSVNLACIRDSDRHQPCLCSRSFSLAPVLLPLEWPPDELVLDEGWLESSTGPELAGLPGTVMGSGPSLFWLLSIWLASKLMPSPCFSPLFLAMALLGGLPSCPLLFLLGFPVGLECLSFLAACFWVFWLSLEPSSDPAWLAVELVFFLLSGCCLTWLVGWFAFFLRSFPLAGSLSHFPSGSTLPGLSGSCTRPSSLATFACCFFALGGFSSLICAFWWFLVLSVTQSRLTSSTACFVLGSSFLGPVPCMGFLSAVDSGIQDRDLSPSSKWFSTMSSSSAWDPSWGLFSSGRSSEQLTLFCCSLSLAAFLRLRLSRRFAAAFFLRMSSLSFSCSSSCNIADDHHPLFSKILCAEAHVRQTNPQPSQNQLVGGSLSHLLIVSACPLSKTPIVFSCIQESLSLLLPTNNLLFKILLRRMTLLLKMSCTVAKMSQMQWSAWWLKSSKWTNWHVFSPSHLGKISQTVQSPSMAMLGLYAQYIPAGTAQYFFGLSVPLPSWPNSRYKLKNEEKKN